MNLRGQHRRRTRWIAIVMLALLVLLTFRTSYLVVIRGEELSQEAQELHERDRSIKAARGRLISSDGTILADNKTVCTISVVHSQITDPERVIDVLTKELEMDEAKVRKYVEKYSSMEKIKSNVSKEVGDRIREYGLDGVKVDEDSIRTYPYKTLASKVLGFTGADNQGIVGLEVAYEDVLRGTNGMIKTVTDAAGIELDEIAETRVEPISGSDLYISIDYSIQKYAQQLAMQAYEAKQAKSVQIIVMNPQNGELLAMVNYPEYDCSDPYTLIGDDTTYSENEYMDRLNQMWRNNTINDTYEPGSTFKVVTATAALEKGVVSLADRYVCTGSTVVSGRTIHCAKTTGHGAETFGETLMNSCNPAFITWGLRVGTESFLYYMDQLGLLEKTGVDLPGEAGTIMHKEEDIHELELATMSFGQSFQITPLQLLRAFSCVINGGTLITPHFAVRSVDADGIITDYQYPVKENVVSEATCETMKELLQNVVENGGGNKCYIEGYEIGGKTATSQKLPRSAQKYIASFIGFAPVDDPQVIAMCIIDEPQGVYYGGQISAPVVKTLFENILPYLGIEKTAVSQTEG